PLSRTVVFASKQEYEKQMKFLKSFDPKAQGQTRPNMKQYTKIQRSKTAQAMQSTLGMDVPISILEKVNELTAPQLSEFWKTFSAKSSKLGVKYSSEAAMQETMNELYPEDIKQFEDLPDQAKK